MIETQIRNLVVPTSSHIEAIGSRLYIGGLPDSVTYPAVAMFVISRPEDMYESGVITDRIQFSCMANYLSSATEIAEAIKDKLKRYRGQESTTESYKIINSWFGSLSYLYDDLQLKYVRILDMFVRYIQV